MERFQVFQDAFFDELVKIKEAELEKEASLGAVAKLVPRALKGFQGGKALKFFGARAGIGAGVGAVGGAATSKPGSTGRGAVRGALLGGAVGAGVGGAQAGRAMYRVGKAHMTGAKMAPGALSGAGKTLQQAGFGSQGLRNVQRGSRLLGRLRG